MLQLLSPDTQMNIYLPFASLFLVYLHIYVAQAQYIHSSHSPMERRDAQPVAIQTN